MLLVPVQQPEKPSEVSVARRSVVLGVRVPDPDGLALVPLVRPDPALGRLPPSVVEKQASARPNSRLARLRGVAEAQDGLTAPRSITEEEPFDLAPVTPRHPKGFLEHGRPNVSGENDLDAGLCPCPEFRGLETRVLRTPNTLETSGLRPTRRKRGRSAAGGLRPTPLSIEVEA
jgi:hypothetical protein